MPQSNFDLDVQYLEKKFIRELKYNSINLAPNTRCMIDRDRIIIYLVEIKQEKEVRVFASEIDLYKRGEINFGSSGSFSPQNLASFWRTIHAASVLTNWEVVMSLVTKYCNMYTELQKQEFLSR